MVSISWMMKALQFMMCQEKTKYTERMCDTWKLATYFAASVNFTFVCVFLRKSWWEQELTEFVCNHSFCSWLMWLIISAGITQYLSCDLHAPDRENQRIAKQHPVHRVKIKVSGWHTAQVLSVPLCYFPAVCFILMPPCCQSNKTFATEAVIVHLRQIRLPHCLWMIILQHLVSHWFIFKESHYYFLLIALSL